MLRLMAYSASRPHDEDFLMQAHEFMTKEPVTVSPDTPTPEIARLLLAHKISAAPVVDDAGTPIGMVSKGDLLGRGDADREARRDWWLMLLAEGEALHPDFLATLRNPQLSRGRSYGFRRSPRRTKRMKSRRSGDRGASLAGKVRRYIPSANRSTPSSTSAGRLANTTSPANISKHPRH
jgi:hypothetical protein